MGNAINNKDQQIDYLKNRLDMFMNVIDSLDPESTDVEDIDRLISMLDDLEAKYERFKKIGNNRGGRRGFFMPKNGCTDIKTWKESNGIKQSALLQNKKNCRRSADHEMDLFCMLHCRFAHRRSERCKSSIKRTGKLGI